MPQVHFPTQQCVQVTAVCPARLSGCSWQPGRVSLLWELWSTAPLGSEEPAMPSQAGETTMPLLWEGGAVPSLNLCGRWAVVGPGSSLPRKRSTLDLCRAGGRRCPALLPSHSSQLEEGWPWCGGNWLTEPKGAVKGQPRSHQTEGLVSFPSLRARLGWSSKCWSYLSPTRLTEEAAGQRRGTTHTGPRLVSTDSRSGRPPSPAPLSPGSPTPPGASAATPNHPLQGLRQPGPRPVGAGRVRAEGGIPACQPHGGPRPRSVCPGGRRPAAACDAPLRNTPPRPRTAPAAHGPPAPPAQPSRNGHHPRRTKSPEGP